VGLAGEAIAKCRQQVFFVFADWVAGQALFFAVQVPFVSRAAVIAAIGPAGPPPPTKISTSCLIASPLL